MSNDMVMFLLPDGSKVSNDPRFNLEEALEKSLNSRPTTGSIGPTWDEQNAQIIAEKLASLQSGQPGVGENAVPEDPTRDLHGPLGSPAQQIQKDDVQRAQELGASPAETATDDDPPVDSNERVAEVRKRQEEAQAAYAKAVEKLGEDGPGEGTDYENWTGKQLKAEVARRNADENRSEEDQLQLQRGMKVADVAAMLKEDDERQAGASAETEAEADGGDDGDADSDAYGDADSSSNDE